MTKRNCNFIVFLRKMGLFVLLFAVVIGTVCIANGAILKKCVAETTSQGNERDNSAFVETQAAAAVLYEATTGTVIYGKNENERRPNASTTKIVTALTVLEHCKDVNELICVPKAAVGVEGSSIYLKEDEKISIYDLLVGLMLQSGNDAAVALALHIGKTLSEFAVLMNETALNCGAENSNFVTPHGLHDDNHYTTAIDLARITGKALENPIFAEIVSKKSAYIGTDENRRFIKNKNKLLDMLPEAVGVKTGYTKKAGRCLVAAAKKDGAVYAAVVLNCGPMFEVCRDMLCFGMNNYTVNDIVKKYQILGSSSALGERRAVMSRSGFKVLEKKGEEKDYRVRLVLERDKNDLSIAGRFDVVCNEKVLFSDKLYYVGK